MKKKDMDRMISMIGDEKLVASESFKGNKFGIKHISVIAACVALVITTAIVLAVMRGSGGNIPVPDDPTPSIPSIGETVTRTSNIAAMTASSAYADGIIANDTGFTVKTSQKMSLESFEKLIYIDPPIEYTVDAVSENEFFVKPAAEIPDNTVVTISEIKDSRVVNSWAYQTQTELSVSSVYPADGALGVSENSVVEITLSCADVENLPDYVTISPHVEGSWEHFGTVWRFTPENGFEKDVRYVVDIRQGYSNAVMTGAQSKSFSFSTFADTELAENAHALFQPIITNTGKIFSYLPGESVAIPFYPFDNKHADISHISLEKLNDADGFIAKLENENADVLSYDLGDADFVWKNISSGSSAEDTVVFDNRLDSGYYIAHIYDGFGTEQSIAYIQVNSISAYAVETNEEVLVWAAQNGVLAKGLEVSCSDGVTKTDDSGLANIKINSSEYIKIGTSEPLVIYVVPFGAESLTGYIYTDRPLYREDDTIQVWGYVPIEMIRDENAEFVLHFGYDKDVAVELDEFGCFCASYEIKDHIADEYYFVRLTCNGSFVTERTIGIKNYSGQYYSYELILDRNYIRNNSVISFDVKVTHISGATVVGKKVYANNHYAVTDENGIAHFSYTVTNSYGFNSQVYFENICIKNGDGVEVNGYSDNTVLYVFDSDIYTDVVSEGNDKYTVNVYKIDFNSDIPSICIGGSGMSSETGVPAISAKLDGAKVTVSLQEEKFEKVEIGKEYDEYTKEYVTVYDTKESYTGVTHEWTQISKDGVASFDISDFSYKAPSEFTAYNYLLYVTASYEGSRTVKYSFASKYIPYAWTSSGEYNQYSGFSCYILPSWKDSDCHVDSAYILYGYKLAVDQNKSYSSKESITATLFDKYENEVSGGTVLMALLQNNIVQTAVCRPDMLSVEYPEDLAPGVYLTGAYFAGGHFNRLPSYYLKYDYEDNKLDISINSDKESYAPGDEVTLDIFVTDKDGNGVSAQVSVDVVNEAVMKLSEESADIFSRLFKTIQYAHYSYSTYFDLSLMRLSGGWGGGGGDTYRGNFGDTALFTTVITDGSGHAAVKFTLPDTVTEYRVVAHAVSSGIRVGVQTEKLVAKLDFFIQHTEAGNVKTTDDLVIGACGIGAEGIVSFEFRLKETMQSVTAEAENSKMAYANFGKLPLGTYTVQIIARCGEYEDALEYPVEIISTAQTVCVAQKSEMGKGETVHPLKNPVVIELCNSDMTRYQKYLAYLTQTVNKRLDTQIANTEAIKFRNEYMGEDLYVPYVQYTDYYDYGNIDSGYLLKPLSTAEADPVLTALASYYSDVPMVAAGTSASLSPYERVLIQAAKRKAVLVDLKYLAQNAESDRDKLLVCIGFAFLGDYNSARECYIKTELKDSKSLQAIAATFIDRDNAAQILDSLMESEPEDSYLRFAVISYLENNTDLIETEESAVIRIGNEEHTLTVKGLEVERITVSTDKLSDITLVSSTDNADVTYFYNTSVDRLAGDNVIRTLNVSLSDPDCLSVDGDVELSIDISSVADHEKGGYITVALPNNLCMTETGASDYNTYVVNKHDHIVIYVNEEASNIISLKLHVLCEGEYEFEPVVYKCGSYYYVSESFVYEAK